MRIEPNEISDYDYINRKLREHAPFAIYLKELVAIACDGGQTLKNMAN